MRTRRWCGPILCISCVSISPRRARRVAEARRCIAFTRHRIQMTSVPTFGRRFSHPPTPTPSARLLTAGPVCLCLLLPPLAAARDPPSFRGDLAFPRIPQSARPRRRVCLLAPICVLGFSSFVCLATMGDAKHLHCIAIHSKQYSILAYTQSKSRRSAGQSFHVPHNPPLAFDRL
jgi:hypothetical protein